MPCANTCVVLAAGAVAQPAPEGQEPDLREGHIPALQLLHLGGRRLQLLACSGGGAQRSSQ